MAQHKAESTIVRPSKRGGCYYYRIGSDAKRTKHSTGQKTLQGAKEFLVLLKDQQNAATAAKGRKNFGEYTAGFFGDECSFLLRKEQDGRPLNSKIVADYRAYLRNYLLPAFGHIELCQITPAMIRKWRESVLTGSFVSASMKTRGGQPPKPRTLNYVVTCMRAIFEQADEDGLIARNPLEKVSNLKVTKTSPHDALTESEMRLLFGDPTQFARVWGTTRNLAMFGLLFGSGLRSGEVRALRWGDVDFDFSGLKLQYAVKADGRIGRPKNGKARAVLLPAAVLQWLRSWELEFGTHGSQDLVFPGEDGETPIGRASLLRTFKRALTACGIDRLGTGMKLVVHSSRHSWNTALVDRNEDELARKILGHSSAEMTALYTHMTLTRELHRMRQRQGTMVDATWTSILEPSENPAELQQIASDLER